MHGILDSTKAQNTQQWFWKKPIDLYAIHYLSVLLFFRDCKNKCKFLDGTENRFVIHLTKSSSWLNYGTYTVLWSIDLFAILPLPMIRSLLSTEKQLFILRRLHFYRVWYFLLQGLVIWVELVPRDIGRFLEDFYG